MSLNLADPFLILFMFGLDCRLLHRKWKELWELSMDKLLSSGNLANHCLCFWTTNVIHWLALHWISSSPRFLCRLTALIKLLVAVQRQRVLYTETIEFASPAIVSAHFHVSWLSDFIFYHKPYINRFTNHFSIHS